jgi:hypothetical protein
MTGSTRDWIAYCILLLHAAVFVFFVLMLLTKLVEGLIRLFGGAHFDESTSPLDSGLFAAIMDLDCLNGVRGGKAAQRKRRKRGSRQLQRNVSAAGSLTTQMMLDRHSLGVQRLSTTDGGTPFSTYPTFESQGLKTPQSALDAQQSYFPAQQPPLGPPPIERHSSDSRSDERSAGGHIMDAWRPSQPLGYALTATSPGWADVSPGLDGISMDSASGPGATRSFSVLRGGRADFQNPYDVKADEPGRALSPPPMRITSPSKPPHNRQQSSSAIVERYDNSAPPSPGLGGAPAIYPPGHSGPRPNNQGLRPPILAIPKRRSLNNLRDDPSPDSQYSTNATAKHIKGKRPKRKSKAKSGSGSGWFGKESESETSPAESDDEPGPSQRRRIPQPFEPAPSPLGEYPDSQPKKKGWRAALGLGGNGGGKGNREEEEMAEMVRDENKARKAALATASGSMFAGVEAPSPPRSPAGKGFVVNRKSARPGVTPMASDRMSPPPNTAAGPSRAQGTYGSQGTSTDVPAVRSFKVKRMNEATSPPPSISVTDTSFGTSPQRPLTDRRNSVELAREIKGQPGQQWPSGQTQAQKHRPGQADSSAKYHGQSTAVPLKSEAGEPVRSFRVLGRKPASPSSAYSGAGGPDSPGGSSFVVNRPGQGSSVNTSNVGYPPTSFAPR